MIRRSNSNHRSDATAPATVRRLVRRVLTEAAHPTTVARAMLLASEVVTNVVIHTDCPECTVLIDTYEDAVRVEVVDCDPTRVPQLLPPDPERFGGIGLHVVNDVARRWGYEVGAASKTVWFEIEDTYRPPS